jgi:hypothetical protein
MLPESDRKDLAIQALARSTWVETAMFRYETIIGRRLQARTLRNQKTEAKSGAMCSTGWRGSECRPSARVGGYARGDRRRHQRPIHAATRLASVSNDCALSLNPTTFRLNGKAMRFQRTEAAS